MSKRRQRSEEFKREAVKLVTEGGYTTAQAARMPRTRSWRNFCRWGIPAILNRRDSARRGMSVTQW